MSVVKSIRRAVAQRQSQQQQRSIPREPSPRNLEIYNRVIANCEPQHLLAAEFNLTPSRISQILRNVSLWLASGGRQAPGTAPSPNPNAPADTSPSFNPQPQPQALNDATPTPHSELRTPHSPSPTPDSLLPTPSASPFLLRLSTLITREEHLHTLFMREYSHHALPPTDPSSTDPLTSDLRPLTSSSPPPLVSPSPSPSIDLAPSDPPPLPPSPVPCPPSSSPLAVQCLKAAHRTLLELRRLYQLEHNLLNPQAQEPIQTSSSTPHSELRTPHSFSPNLPSLSSLQDALHLLRQEAEDEGLVPQSPDIDSLVQNLLDSFLGKSQSDDPGFHTLNDSHRQFLTAFLASPTKHSPETEQFLAGLVGSAGPAAPDLPTDATTQAPSDPPNDTPSPSPPSAFRTPHSALFLPSNPKH